MCRHVIILANSLTRTRSGRACYINKYKSSTGTAFDRNVLSWLEGHVVKTGKLARGIQIIALDYSVLMMEGDTKIQNVNIGRASDQRTK